MAELKGCTFQNTAPNVVTAFFVELVHVGDIPSSTVHANEVSERSPHGSSHIVEGNVCPLLGGSSGDDLTASLLWPA